MIVLPIDPTPIAVPVANHPFRVYHPTNRESLRTQHPTWWWMYTWASGILLSWELEKLTEQKTILEVGCGLGLASVVASYLGHDITCTDVVEETEYYVGLTARSSATKIPKWKSVSDVTGTFDMIMLSDVLYTNFKTPVPLFEYMTERLSIDGEIWCVEPYRPEILTPALSVLSEMGLELVHEEMLSYPRFSDGPWETDQYVKMIIRRTVS